MSKLKPCPFCGNKAEVYEECELIKIRCSNYMCQASVNSWHDEVEDAIDAWNKRSADRPKHYCAECKFEPIDKRCMPCSSCTNNPKNRDAFVSCEVEKKGADDE